MSHFFEIASTGIAEVTWRRAPIHTKIGRFSCCDFYSCNCPSLGIATAAEQKYSPPGHWDVGLQWRKKPRGAGKGITSSHQTREQELGPQQANTVRAEPGSLKHLQTTRPQLRCPLEQTDPCPAPCTHRVSSVLPTSLQVQEISQGTQSQL